MSYKWFETVTPALEDTASNLAPRLMLIALQRNLLNVIFCSESMSRELVILCMNNTELWLVTFSILKLRVWTRFTWCHQPHIIQRARFLASDSPEQGVYSWWITGSHSILPLINRSTFLPWAKIKRRNFGKICAQSSQQIQCSVVYCHHRAENYLFCRPIITNWELYNCTKVLLINKWHWYI